MRQLRSERQLPVTLRPLAVGDLDAVMAIDAQSYATVWPADLLRAEIELEDRYHLVAILDGAVVAHGSVMFVLDEATVTTVAVDPAQRGHGLGAVVMRALLAEAARRATAAVTLEVRAGNEVAIALYEQLGFVVEGRRKRYYEPDGEDALIMWLRNMTGFERGPTAPAAEPTDNKPPDTEPTDNKPIGIEQGTNDA